MAHKWNGTTKYYSTNTCTTNGVDNTIVFYVICIDVIAMFSNIDFICVSAVIIITAIFFYYHKSNTFV